MKTLIITLEYPPQSGGISSFVANFAAHSLPNEIVIYAPQLKGDTSFDEFKPWKTYRKNPYFAFIWPRWLKLVWQVWRICRQENIAMINVHHALPVGYVAYILKKVLHIPYTLFIHGTDINLAMKGRFKRNTFKKVCANAEKIIVNIRFLQEKVKLALGEQHPPITILYPVPADIFLSAVDPDRLAALRAKLALTGKKVILTVARLADGKGYPHLVHLLPELLNKIPNLVWVILGTGPKQKEIMASIAKNSLQNVVRFLGEVTQAELPAFYQLADL